ncbi:CLAVATA3/ESR (CLE)-related protein 25 [Quillaja saponaria]|uniref:CLAVATA3/ESR (CLE)-related protein 25 n=1 Tax=Quillaja saponaria TaxID=32244 RepID=A0AAD7P6H2_QUISA|nr:CLAVATA3/ESR (CLE)-related protein 25 [Quillaja saponaria]
MQATSSNSSSLFRMVFFRAVAIVFFLCLLVVVGSRSSSSEGTRRATTSTPPTTLSPGKLLDRHEIGEKEIENHSELDLINYMSKRRVPNGPDPIHNRRAGNSGRPPGQA